MKIGIIGLGVVGDAVRLGLEWIGHDVVGYDIKYPETSIKDVLGTDICFITVPTPQCETGSCDTSIVESVVSELAKHDYKGLAVIKSTVTPGTTDRLNEKYGIRLAFCPEFLRERAAYTDFVENHDVCVIGVYNDVDFELVKTAHGHLPKKVVQLLPKEAEFTKYFSNVFNALRIIFANEFYEVCKAAGVDYSKVKDAMINRQTIIDAYLDCNENLRGYGGVCLPKDTAAFNAFAKEIGTDVKLFDVIIEVNKKLKKTVFDGMRK